MSASTPAASPGDGARLQLQDVQVQFANDVEALADVSLRVQAGEFVALVGPSGCGKSTVLRLCAGLQAASRGRVQAPAQEAGRADTAFVFQEATLMPWATLLDNVQLPLRLLGQPLAQRTAAARAQLQAVGLADFENAYPAQLSGGMKMRASIARALVTQPAVLLMDEPFAALDDLTRQRLHADLLHWWQQLRPATLFVTHNVAEAVYLSQRVLVMSARPGRIVAEISTEAAHPRTPEFRRSAQFHSLCDRVSAALEQTAT